MDKKERQLHRQVEITLWSLRVLSCLLYFFFARLLTNSLWDEYASPLGKGRKTFLQSVELIILLEWEKNLKWILGPFSRHPLALEGALPWDDRSDTHRKIPLRSTILPNVGTWQTAWRSGQIFTFTHSGHLSKSTLNEYGGHDAKVQLTTTQTAPFIVDGVFLRRAKQFLWYSHVQSFEKRV